MPSITQNEKNESSQSMDNRNTVFGNSEEKIIPFDSLTLLKEKHPGKKIVLCHGAFDLVHLGHIIHFKQAKDLGDLLVITVTADDHITKKRKANFPQEDRASQLAALEIVDYVSIIHEPSAVTSIELLKPDFYVKGGEYQNLMLDKSKNIYREKEVVEANGGELAFTGGQTFSSTKLSYFLQTTPEAVQNNPLLRNDGVKFKDISNRNISLESVKEFIYKASKLKVCVIGETILDKWIDVSLSNVSMKSKCITGNYIGVDEQVGGAGVVALHVSNFVESVDFFSNSFKAKLPDNTKFFPLSNSELVKERYVDKASKYTLFEAKKLDIELSGRYELPDFENYDLVIIADFGHGLIDVEKVNKKIAANKKAFVAAMAQVNSSNFGFNLPIKYQGADYYSANRVEAELSLNVKALSLESLLEKLYDTLSPAKALSVTAGPEGALLKSKNKVEKLDSLSELIVDTIGCGDAYLAFSSLALASGCDELMALFAGNVGAGAMAQKRCNESPVSEEEFMTISKIVI